MGLFSFLKNAGASIFKGKEAEVKAVETNSNSAEETAAKLKALKESLLISSVTTMGLKVEDLSVNMEDETVTVYGQVESQEDREKVILTLGNVEGVASVDDRLSVVTPAPEATFYEVKKGDYLSKIAKEVYGDAMKYPVIFEANKPMLKAPDLIYPGQMRRIPPLNA